MKAKRNHSDTFADMLNEVEQTPPRAEETWSSPIGEREWRDGTGTRWQMRGELLDAEQARRLFKESETRVVHFAPVIRLEDGRGQPSDVWGSARDELWAQIDESFKEDPPQSRFHLGRFRDDHGAVMVMVVEFC